MMWEYLVETHPPETYRKEYAQWLNEFGRQGWELISRDNSPRERTHVFKRPVGDPHDYRKEARDVEQ